MSSKMFFRQHAQLDCLGSAVSKSPPLHRQVRFFPRRQRCVNTHAEVKNGVSTSYGKEQPARNRTSSSRTGPTAPTQPTTSSSEQGWAPQASQLLAEVVASPLFYFVAGAIAIGILSMIGESDYAVFFLAAAPITFLTALSKSSVGKQVQDALESRLPQLQADASKVRALHAVARQSSTWYGPQRPLWPSNLGGGAEHLTGQVAGDYGFDPLNFSTEPSAFARNYEAELLHARWAMLSAVGCLIPEALSMGGVELGEPVWWKVGAEKLNGDITLNWAGIEGFRIAGKQGIAVIAACQLVLMGGPEYARYVGIKSLEPVGVFLPGEQIYPGGGPFDPLNFAGNADGFVDQAVKEIKNGRLAMVAMLGYFAQAAVTREGPLRNLMDFIDDPVHNNITAYL